MSRNSTNEPLVIVPARGGSKGVPRKNLLPSPGGLTLAARALHIGRYVSQYVVLSTDDQEIRLQGELLGHLVVKQTTHDRQLAVNVWKEAWEKAENYWNLTFKRSLYLEPTSPCRTRDDLLACLEMLEAGASAVATVSQVPKQYNPNRQLVMENGVLKGWTKEAIINQPRQNFEWTYHRNGICYAARRRQVMNGKMVEGAMAHLIDRDVVNIDTPKDVERMWEICPDE